MYELFVGFQPCLDLGLCQTVNGLFGIGGVLTAVTVHKVQTLGVLEQNLLIAGRIAKIADNTLLNNGSSFGIVLFLADDLLHGICLLSSKQRPYYT